ncbi:hypothetical protein M3Y98_00172900 [Aphelenchoides besseyi]|nr:hypothetical protein M3Y98_00172900 [Aphelenchoides besseyi]KAI6200023.1 hypothetical protein M3Y96_00689600 [Aphelenchoides besseyi]
MLEDELRNILSSLSHLASQGDIPVQAFATLIRSARTEILAEHLHQRWLADHNFGFVAGQILSHSHNDERRDMKLCSQVLSLILDDYKHRYGLRQDDRRMFRNYCRTLIELLPVFLQIDRYMAQGLVRPLFDSLHMLVDEAHEDEDYQILVRSGSLLGDLNSNETEKLVMKMRSSICFHERKLRSYTRFIMLNAVDLYTYHWKVELMPSCLFEFYADQYERFHINDYDEKRWLPMGMNWCGESGSSLAAASSVSSFSHNVITPEPTVEPESIV